MTHLPASVAPGWPRWAPWAAAVGLTTAFALLLTAQRYVLQPLAAPPSTVVEPMMVTLPDYLLKPFDRERFYASLRWAKAQVRLRRQNSLAMPEDVQRGVRALLGSKGASGRYPDRLAISCKERIYFVKVDQIDWIEADGNRVRLHTGKDVHVLRSRVIRLERQLPPNKFVRVHRSAIVNLDRVQEIQRWFKRDYLFILSSGAKVTSGRRYRERLRDLIKSQ